MKQLKSKAFFKFLVLLYLVTYVAGSFTNMLFIPRYVPVYTNTSTDLYNDVANAVKYANFHAPNFLQIIDKSTIDNDQVNPVFFLPKSFLVIFKSYKIADKTPTPKAPQSSIHYNHQYSYLSFCTFRI